MSSQRVKKELYETAMTGEKALTSLMYVQMTLYESVFKSGRKGSGKLSKPSERDTSAGRASVKGRNISGPDGTCAGCDGEKTDVPQGTDRDGRESKGNSRTDRGAAEKHAGAWSISHRLAGSA